MGPNPNAVYPNEAIKQVVYIKDCACLFSKRNTDITSNIEKA